LFFLLAAASYNLFVLNRQPTREDIISIVHGMYRKDGLSVEEVARVVDAFPNQGTFCTTLFQKHNWTSIFSLVYYAVRIQFIVVRMLFSIPCDLVSTIIGSALHLSEISV